MSHLVVYNPAAGRGKRRRSPEDVLSALDQHRVSCEVAVTEGPGHAAELIRERSGSPHTLIVVGGDGSLHEAVQALDLEHHRLGVIPWGSGNDFGWMQGWTEDLDACARRIARGEERRIDLGTWRGRYADGVTTRGRFHNSIGLGFEAVVNHESHRVTAVKGPLLYGVALLRTLRRFRCYPVTLDWGGDAVTTEAALVTIANGRRVGGTFLLAPQAAHDSGRLELVLAERLGWTGMLALLPRTLKGTHVRSKQVRTASIQRLRVDAPEGIPAYVDGEFLGMRLVELEIEVMPGVLRGL
jgi:diacylglycerol kinase (ATP)